MDIFKRVLLAANQAACLILTGQNDLTISAWAYVKKIEDDKHFCNNAINKLFWWQPNHCKNALIWEIEEARKQQERFKAAYLIATHSG
jgi:hypothetical protein